MERFGHNPHIRRFEMNKGLLSANNDGIRYQMHIWFKKYYVLVCQPFPDEEYQQLFYPCSLLVLCCQTYWAFQHCLYISVLFQITFNTDTQTGRSAVHSLNMGTLQWRRKISYLLSKSIHLLVSWQHYTDWFSTLPNCIRAWLPNQYR